MRVCWAPVPASAHTAGQGLGVVLAVPPDEFHCDQCYGGLTFSSDGDRWCWMCDPEVETRMTYPDDLVGW